jgi:hypothetical protein
LYFTLIVFIAVSLSIEELVLVVTLVTFEDSSSLAATVEGLEED